ncbi:Serine protease family s10 [Globisporangium polare]
MTDLESFQCSVADTSTSLSSTLHLGVEWLWVAVVISVVSSVLAVSVTLMCIRNKKTAKQRTSGHAMIVQESDEDDSGDDEVGQGGKPESPVVKRKAREERDGGDEEEEEAEFANSPASKV